jgi:hypothetical protein
MERKLIVMVATLQWSLLRKESPVNVAAKRALNVSSFLRKRHLAVRGDAFL